MTSIPLCCKAVTRPARRKACGAFSCPTPCAPALEGTPMRPIFSNISHLSFSLHHMPVSHHKPGAEHFFRKNVSCFHIRTSTRSSQPEYDKGPLPEACQEQA